MDLNPFGDYSDNEPSIGAGGLGNASPTTGTGEYRDAVLVREGTKKASQGVVTVLKGLTKAVKSITDELNRVATNKFNNYIGNVDDDGGGPQNAATNTAQVIGAASRRTSRMAGQSKQIASQQALGAGGGNFANFRGAAFASAGGGAGIASGAVQVGQMAFGAMDRRIDSAYSRMLQTDRLGVLMQQMYGINQQQYYNQMRLPLQGYRLGQGGISELLALQASTGISAQGQAAGVAGFRAASGYSYSTQDFTQMLRTLASPQVSNRMTMTMGLGLYGIGGRQRSITEIMQGVVSRTGLTNEAVLRGAMQPGSMTRARLSAMGIPEDMQDMILQYAQQNSQFQRKTGGRMGMYNPENAGQRNLMGIEGNFATQSEETTRLAEAREEKFYNRQKDNMASLERNTQAMIALTTAIEDTLSGAIGARISTRGNPLMRLGRGIAGLGMMAAGAYYTFQTGGAGGVLGGGALMGMGSQMFLGAFQGGPKGDPVERGKSDKGTFSTGGNANAGKFNNLHATFKSRLLQMTQDNPNISISDGFRTASDQRSLFFSRYERSNEPTGVFWNGSYWKKRPNVPDAAPPGMSLHELGLAVDLGGDIEWVAKNASKYGLKTFSNVGEPWHVQPAELPDTRREYESMGAPWGRPTGAAPFDPRSTFTGRSVHSDRDKMKKRMNKGVAISSYAADRKITLIGAGGSTSTVSGRKKAGSLARGVPSASEIPPGFMFRTTPSYGGWGYYVPMDFSDADLEALHRREQPSWKVGEGPAVNSHGTFYGGFSMNDTNWNRAKEGLAKAGVDTSKWGPHANDTIDRQKMAAEWLLEKASAHNGWEPIVRGSVDWPGVGRLPSVRMPDVTDSNRVTIRSNQTGDPMMGGPSRDTGGTTVVGGSTVTIAPNIYIQTAGNNTADAHRAAMEVSKIISNDIKMNLLRGM